MAFKHLKIQFTLLWIFVLLSLNGKSQPWKDYGRLQVLPSNPHYISHEDGTPFFWMGDTGWEILHRLSRDEIDHYMSTRKSQGFNVIQTVIVSQALRSMKPTNFYGDEIFISGDPSQPLTTRGNDPEDQEAYDFWDHVDYAVTTAEYYGLYLALLPTWGEWVIAREGKPIFNNTQQTYEYGQFLGNRYKNRPNVIWVLGGDRHPDERPSGVELWQAMAEGIADGINGMGLNNGKADYTTTLMTHHGYASSSSWFHNDEWIDFHMYGSYHADFYVSRAYEVALKDWNLPDPKPTINAEPNYEDHPLNYAIEGNSFFRAADVRIMAYWSVFSGSAGFTYGAHAVWQCTDSTRPPLSSFTRRNWQESLKLEGADHVTRLRELMKSRPMKDLMPDQSLIIAGQGQGSNYICAIRGQSHAFIYIPTGADITIRMGILTGERIKAWWYDPRTGKTKLINEYANSGEKRFRVPGRSKETSWLRSGRGCDWVLVLEDASMKWKAPGEK